MESQAVTFHVVEVAGIDTVKLVEDMRQLFPRDADAVVLHLDDDVVAAIFCADDDLGISFAVFQGVVNQVGDGVADMDVVADDGVVLCHQVQYDFRVLRFRRQFVHLCRGFNYFMQRERLWVRYFVQPVESHRVQHFLDQLFDFVVFFGDDVDVGLYQGLVFLEVVVLQGLTGKADGGDGRLDFVRHVVHHIIFQDADFFLLFQDVDGGEEEEDDEEQDEYEVEMVGDVVNPYTALEVREIDHDFIDADLAAGVDGKELVAAFFVEQFLGIIVVCDVKKRFILFRIDAYHIVRLDAVVPHLVPDDGVDGGEPDAEIVEPEPFCRQLLLDCEEIGERLWRPVEPARVVMGVFVGEEGKDVGAVFNRVAEVGICPQEMVVCFVVDVDDGLAQGILGIRQVLHLLRLDVHVEDVNLREDKGNDKECREDGNSFYFL